MGCEQQAYPGGSRATEQSRKRALPRRPRTRRSGRLSRSGRLDGTSSVTTDASPRWPPSRLSSASARFTNQRPTARSPAGPPPETPLGANRIRISQLVGVAMLDVCLRSDVGLECSRRMVIRSIRIAVGRSGRFISKLRSAARGTLPNLNWCLVCGVLTSVRAAVQVRPPGRRRGV